MAETPLPTDRKPGAKVQSGDINNLAGRVNTHGQRLDVFPLDALSDVAVPSVLSTTKYLAFDPTQGLWVAVDPPAGGASPVSSVAGKVGVVTLTKADVGLGNVDNTPDTNKPISVQQQAALDGKAPLVNSKIPATYLPDLAITQYLGTVASDAAMFALTAQRGDFVTRTDSTIMPDGSPAVGDWIAVSDTPTTIAGWHRLTGPSSSSGGVTSVNGKLGPAVTLVASDLLTNGVTWQANTDATRKAPPTGWLLIVIGGTTPPSWLQPGDRWLAEA